MYIYAYIRIRNHVMVSRHIGAWGVCETPVPGPLGMLQA